MGFDLIEEPWIPVRRKSGKAARIAPWQIAESADPPVRVESARPDFDAALTEMLIALVQTAFTPKDDEEWEEVYKGGIEPTVLLRRFESIRDAFRLVGEGPRFMQDLTVHENHQDKKPVVALLMDEGQSGDSSLFAKAGRFESFCLPDAAAALMTIQAFAPSGGVGHRTSLRGGGPLSVVIQDETLWRTVWCNVLTRMQVRFLPGDSNLKEMKDIFPWLAETRTSEKKGDAGIGPPMIHPMQHYWAMPRRIRLVVDGLRGTCDLCGEAAVEVVQSYFSRNYGANYKGAYLHPLTPYKEGKRGEPPNPKKGDASGISYRDWPLAFLGGDGLLPPKVVEVLLRDRMRFLEQEREEEDRSEVSRYPGLIARGYAMANMKPLRFVEAELPAIHVGPDALEAVRNDVAGLVAASEEVCRTIGSQVRAAWKDRPKDQSGDVQARIETAFWGRTESAFYEAVRLVDSARQAHPEDPPRAAKHHFLESLQVAALIVFDELCPLDVDIAPDGLARTAKARRSLRAFTSPGNSRLLGVVGLAVEPTKDSKRLKGKHRKSVAEPVKEEA